MFLNEVKACTLRSTNLGNSYFARKRQGHRHGNLSVSPSRWLLVYLSNLCRTSGIVNDEAENDGIYTMTSTSSGKFNDHFTYLYFRTYHDYAKSMGTTFTKPDLAIAFNSGCSQEAASSWKETIVFLVQNKIPSVFTVGYFCQLFCSSTSIHFNQLVLQL